MLKDHILIDRIIKNALAEDLGPGDLTTDAIIGQDIIGRAVLEAREDIILAGLPVFMRVFSILDPLVTFETFYNDGERVPAGKIVCAIKGGMAVILKAERTALNLIQRMSGIATITSHYVEKAGSDRVKILDTRKTAPGLRLLDKYAVPIGGGHNHRFGLYDAILIKDNHIAVAGGIRKAIEAARTKAPDGIKIEVEVEDINGLNEAIEARADIILLDNMPPEQLKKAVKLVAGRALLEASGGITIENIKEIAATGVDMISVGALTHSVRAVDLGLEISSL
ncbi:MAG: carboxylating nicotinate-nucleotide diphosphorylase [Desulfatiglans sp.]|jgi:nicotinate-nucleotide pyrophosphorylase (carboxylating)|nr:carboxylating nicotinate-nucleotide diphosphorylase [Desulfatiglans sp.]